MCDSIAGAEKHTPGALAGEPPVRLTPHAVFPCLFCAGESAKEPGYPVRVAMKSSKP